MYASCSRLKKVSQANDRESVPFLVQLPFAVLLPSSPFFKYLFCVPVAQNIQLKGVLIHHFNTTVFTMPTSLPPSAVVANGQGMAEVEFKPEETNALMIVPEQELLSSNPGKLHFIIAIIVICIEMHLNCIRV